MISIDCHAEESVAAVENLIRNGGNTQSSVMSGENSKTPIQNRESIVSLDEAIEIALANHPRLKMANAEIERTKATKGEIWMVETHHSVMHGDNSTENTVKIMNCLLNSRWALF